MHHSSILIVDNRRSGKRGIRKIMEPLRPRIFEAENEKQGFSQALTANPDIIISRTAPPHIDGIELCRKLKEHVSTKDIPVVLFGRLESETTISCGFKAGAKAYIKEEEAPKKLLTTATKLLEQAETRNEKIILVVDDSSAIRQMMWEGLSNKGYRVITAQNGKEALNILQENRPDLILCDICMPVMNGFQLCETLHSDPFLSTIPFVVMSTEDDAGSMKRMMQYGAASYIVKPVNIEQLIIILEKIFSFQFHILLKEKERLDTERTLLISSITSLVTALEARDLYTRGHSDRVANIVAKLVNLSGGNRAETDRALIAGKLHDIGKIGIRDNVLLKKGRLTDEEFKHIQEHPVIGTNILKSIESISDIINIVSSHHERIDGKGYPHGLKGEEIHLWARMTAVADTYDALTSDRPYRKGMEEGRALQIISDAKGSQLCPECVALFFDIYDKEEMESNFQFVDYSTPTAE